MTGSTYDEVEYVLAEIITEATGEPRVGRFERTLAEAALARLRELGMSLPTPPADDVREALARIVKQVSQKFGGPSMAEFANDPPLRKHYATADAICAAFEVRPHGTVTDTEPVWEYGVRHVAVDGWPTERVHTSLEGARADIATCGWNCCIIRRRADQEAGQWEPVDATGEASS